MRGSGQSSAFVQVSNVVRYSFVFHTSLCRSVFIFTSIVFFGTWSRAVHRWRVRQRRQATYPRTQLLQSHGVVCAQTYGTRMWMGWRRTSYSIERWVCRVLFKVFQPPRSGTVTCMNVNEGPRARSRRWRSCSGTQPFSPLFPRIVSRGRRWESRATRRISRVLLPLTEPTGNVAPRIAGERYEGGKLVDVPRTLVVALDCSIQGFPVPVTRYSSFVFGNTLRSRFRGHNQDSSAFFGQESRKGSGFGC